MPFRRTPVKIFQLGNPLYASAVVTFFAIDGSGNPTTSLVPLYTDASGGTAAANPQTLDSNGKLTGAVWHDQPFVAKIGTAVVPAHQTAVWYPDNSGFFQGSWATATLYYVGDTVRDAATANVYSCLVQHVSSVLATDVAGGKWQLVLDIATANGDVTTATAQAGIATTEAGIATTQAGIATTQATNAAASAAAAAASAAAVPALAVHDIAAATTTDIGSANFTVNRITGTATITSLGTAAAGTIRDVRTTGSPTFQNNANIVIPWGADIQAQPNDHLRFISNGGGVWQLEGWFPAGGTIRPIVVTAAANLVAGLTYHLEQGAGPLTLPASAVQGDRIRIHDVGGICGQSPVAVQRNGSTIGGQSTDYSINLKGCFTDFAKRPSGDWGVNIA